MNEIIKKAVVAALSGFLAAAVVDVNAWIKSGGDFDWMLAFKRWVSGALTGAMTGAGLSGVA